MRTLAELIFHRRRLVLLAVLLVSGVFGSLLPSLRVVTDVEYFFLEDDPDLAAFRTLQKEFGSEEFLALAYSSDDVFSKKSLEDIKYLTEAIIELPQVEQTYSITQDIQFVWRGDHPEFQRLIRRYPPSPGVKAYAIRELETNPFFRDILLSKDGRSAFIIAQLQAGLDSHAMRIEVTRNVEKVIARRAPGRVRLIGVPVYVTALYREVLRDIKYLVPLTALLMGFFLFFSFRSIVGLLCPAVVMALSLEWTLGLFALFDRPITLVSGMIFPLVLAIGVTSCLHIISTYYENLAAGEEKEEALVSATAQMLPPCFYTAFTTAAGFSMLVLADVRPVRETGLFAAAGMMGTFLLSMTIVPLALHYAPAPPPERAGRLSGGKMGKALAALARFDVERGGRALLGALLLAFISAFGVSLLNAETNPIKFFKKRSAIRKTHEFFERKLGGTMPMDLLFVGDETALREVATYRSVRKVQDEMQKNPDLHGVVSAVDVIEFLYDKVNMTGPALPLTDKDLGRYLHFVERSRLLDREPLVLKFFSSDWNKGRIMSRVGVMGSGKLRALFKSVEDYANDHAPQGLTYRVAGMVNLLVNMMDKVVRSQLISLSAAVTVIALLFALLLGNARQALVAMIPNLLPIGITLGIMGFMGIDIDVATCMMPSVAVGLAVDDTIHFLIRYRSELSRGLSREEAVRVTILSKGRAFIFTSCVLFFGFGVLVNSNLVPVAAFGVISAATMAAALFADLVVLPALLLLGKEEINPTDNESRETDRRDARATIR